MLMNRLLRSAAVVGLGALALASCATDPRHSKEYKALKRSRDDVIAAAVRVRNGSRPDAQPSEKYFGNYYRCAGKDSVHYHLETDWITPRDDKEDFRTFNYVFS